MFSLFSLLACTSLSDGADTAPMASEVVDLATSEHGTCAVTAAGELWCWGALATGSATNLWSVPGPTRVEGLPPVVEVELGQVLCVRYTDGSVGCYDATAVRVDETGIRVGAPPLVYEDAVAFDVGYTIVLRQSAAGEATLQAWWDDTLQDPEVFARHTAEASLGVRGQACARDDDGTVHCLGRVDRESLPPASTARAGVQQLCLLDEIGAPWCWSMVDDDVTAIPDVTGAVDLSVGDGQACALLTDGAVSCWGDLAPLDLAGLPPIVALSGDYDHTCGIDADGGVWCWGADLWGKLGGTGPGPVAVVGLP